MRVLVIGSGGREHAICYQLKQSKKVEQIYAIPGNGGLAKIACCLNINLGEEGYLKKIKEVVNQEKIDLTIVGSETPLVDGIVDYFKKDGLKIFGPQKAAAMIEGSKAFAKEFMVRHQIPTPRYKIFEDAQKAIKYLEEHNYPLVVKYDGLAAGKGVFICQGKEEATQAIDDILVKKIFSQDNPKIIIEDFEEGEEISLLAFCDGQDAICLPSARDHKRLLDGDKGPNTGGMGAYSPFPLVDDQLLKKIKEEILLPTVAGLRNEGRAYVGVLYLGLIKTKEEVKVLEYNARLGDPEAQVLLPRLETDLIEIIEACLEGRIKEIKVRWRLKSCLCVVLASSGYPETVKKGKEIEGLEIEDNEVIIFHAGTRREGDKIVTNGGRVLGVTALGEDILEAKEKAYQAVKKINFEGMYYRCDIGRNYA
ncbi:phosphoribosylamine--glycine ligase [bacterium]|nr:phosphoribosylamine--glycine ligase [bacterium]MBU1153299.1 phosphoribosylamine--glycine ligase [bacterium]MBU1782616.1 phosphoribosylamine--glycine ligase [bacterium]MBU2598993.1 phosphoribosylamine--glycine ligase [bacterium]